VVMLVYVNQAVAARERQAGFATRAILRKRSWKARRFACGRWRDGRLIIAGLLPIMFGSGTARK